MLSSVKRMLQAETSLRGNPPLGRLSLLKKLPQQPDSPDISHRPRYDISATSAAEAIWKKDLHQRGSDRDSRGISRHDWAKSRFFNEIRTFIDPKGKSALDARVIKIMAPSRREQTNQIDTLVGVRRCIRDKFGRQYGVEPFGSVSYGVALPGSDLDLIIIDPERPQGHNPEQGQGLPPIYNSRKLARVLGRAGFQINAVIPFANVPIVKFRDPHTNIECDINVNERLGILNSNLIAAYCDIFPLLRPMLTFIKLWAKPRGLNESNPVGKQPLRTFSSYALTMMAIGCLQRQRLLPNLQGDLTDLPYSRDESFWIRKPRVMLCDTRFRRRVENWQPPAVVHLREVMQQWFKCWGHEFNYQEEILCIREGGPVLKTRNYDVREAHRLHVCIVDPFIRSRNVAKGIAAAGLSQFVLECRRAVEMLEGGAVLDDLLRIKP